MKNEIKTRGNVLVVDDDPDIGAMLKMILEYKGYAVTLLSNASQTEQILSNRQADIVILDMLIAGLNGADICRNIKSHPNSAHMPVLMISALSDARKTCLDAGANDFSAKPFEIEEILAKVNHLIHEVRAVNESDCV